LLAFVSSPALGLVSWAGLSAVFFVTVIIVALGAAVALRLLVSPVPQMEPSVENHADGTTLITINRPERRNAICAETALMLQKAFQDFERL
jgi:hypothetical protein